MATDDQTLQAMATIKAAVKEGWPDSDVAIVICPEDGQIVVMHNCGGPDECAALLAEGLLHEKLAKPVHTVRLPGKDKQS